MNSPHAAKSKADSAKPLPQGFPWGSLTAENTDAYKTSPKSGVIRSYDFTLARAFIAPDGVNKSTILVNGKVYQSQLHQSFAMSLSELICWIVSWTNYRSKLGRYYPGHCAQQDRRTSRGYFLTLAWSTTKRNSLVRWGCKSTLSLDRLAYSFETMS